MNVWPGCFAASGPFCGGLLVTVFRSTFQQSSGMERKGIIMKGPLLLLLCAAFPALAASKAPVDLKAPRPFAEQAEQVRRDLSDGDTYAEIGADNRAKVLAALQRMQTALQASSDPAQLTPESSAAVFNDQELVNALLTKAGEESRMVCQRVRAVGSHLSTTQCMTVAERRRLRDGNKDELTRLQRQNVATQPGM
ncbi:hypothetical protein ACI6Q5_09215 [Xanthomonas codiaei]|uniref:DUF4168 domain-containing protein n=2 Tax=Xanthomonas codiaei TaxID=56463 RepID=A0ABW9MK69_9XANT